MAKKTNSTSGGGAAGNAKSKTKPAVLFDEMPAQNAESAAETFRLVHPKKYLQRFVDQKGNNEYWTNTVSYDYCTGYVCNIWLCLCRIMLRTDYQKLFMDSISNG